MKLSHLLFGVLAGVAFVACTNDNEPAGVTPVKGDNEVAANKSYLKVDFVMPGGADTRAWDGDPKTGYVAGENAENAVTKVLFFFMKDQAQVADPYEISADNNGNLNALEGTKLNPWADGDEKTIEKLSNIVVVLANKVENPTEIIAVLNAGLSDLKLSKTSTLGDIQAVVGKYAEQANAENNPNFVMSSSIYDEVREKVGAHVDEQKVYETLEEAKAKPSVRIPVERVVAKVNVITEGATQNTGNSADATKPSTTVSVVTVDDDEDVTINEDVTIKAEITGWWLDNNPSQSLLIKKLDASYTVEGTALDKNWYNDATNYRSYWATPNTGDWNHYAYTTKANVARYTLENTDQAHPTQVVVAATLKDAGNNPLDLVKYMGELYTKDGFDTELINVLAHKYWIVEEGEDPRTVGADDVVLTYNPVAGKQYEAEVTIAKAVEDGQTPADWYIKGTGETYTKADPSADFNALKRTVQFWNGGKTYYFVKIVQNDGITVGTGDKAHKLYGVIRNHLYQITAKSINGLGTPVPFSDTDINTPIIPVIPEDDRSYISAEIAILKYKLVSQDVNLGAE